MNNVVIIIASIVASLVMGYLLLACRRSMWPFAATESYGQDGAAAGSANVSADYFDTIQPGAVYIG